MTHLFICHLIIHHHVLPCPAWLRLIGLHVHRHFPVHLPLGL